MTDVKYQVWVDDTWRVGDIAIDDEMGASCDSVIDYAYSYACIVWNALCMTTKKIERSQIKVYRINEHGGAT